ncbi:TadE/TadG family type IV pilus assembly protein [Limimaricola soesokkakensis]|uniref:TadE/TadG family type IV pilus assembly protein n=1 Tax=Limimaricola soesokkakensis TaxID=1343159 RepID=UPI0035161B84
MARPLRARRQNDGTCPLLQRPPKLLASLVRSDQGTATVEFVLWLPVMVVVLLVAAQGAMLFMVQADYGSLARDTARLISRHAMTITEVDDYIASRTLIGGAPEATVQIANGLVTVTLTKPALEVAAIDVLNLTEGFELTASVTQSLEPR